MTWIGWSDGLRLGRVCADGVGMMHPNEVRRLLAPFNLPGGALINAEALVLDYGYPLESAAARALDWHEHSLRIEALGVARAYNV